MVVICCSEAQQAHHSQEGERSSTRMCDTGQAGGRIQGVAEKVVRCLSHQEDRRSWRLMRCVQ